MKNWIFATLFTLGGAAAYAISYNLIEMVTESPLAFYISGSVFAIIAAIIQDTFQQ